MWILLALAAGSLQVLRNSFAKGIADDVSPALNSWARFAFNLPWAAGVVALTYPFSGLPAISGEFLGLCAFAGLTQLLGNTALVAAFRHSNFAESIALHKLEVVFAAIVGMAFFSERPSSLGWGGIALCAAGTLAINLGRSSGPAGWKRAFHIDRGGALAMSCGLLFMGAAFAVKQAVTALEAMNPAWDATGILVPAHTLFHVTWIEVAILTPVVFSTELGLTARVRRHLRSMVAIGVTSYASSLCWFWAFSIALVAYVRAVGQIESVLAVALALLWWREREALRQIPGVALVVSGIVLILFD